MATRILEDFARERSTFVVDVAFRNAAGAAITPTAASWSLYDPRDVAMNSRANVAITTPSATVSITLAGADLATYEDEVGDMVTRTLVASATHGGNVYLDQVKFSILRIAGSVRITREPVGGVE